MLIQYTFIAIIAVCLILLLAFGSIVLLSFPLKYKVDEGLKKAFVRYVVAQLVVTIILSFSQFALEYIEKGTLFVDSEELTGQWNWNWIGGGWQSKLSIEEDYSVIGSTHLFRANDENSGKRIISWKVPKLDISLDEKSMTGELNMESLPREFKVASVPRPGTYNGKIELKPMLCYYGTWSIDSEIKENGPVEFDSHVPRTGQITLCKE